MTSATNKPSRSIQSATFEISDAMVRVKCLVCQARMSASNKFNRGSKPKGRTCPSAHPADQISDLARNDGSSRLAMPDLPGPEKAEASTMPDKDRLGLNDGQRRAPVAPDAGQTDPQQAVRWGQLRAFSRGALKDADLVAQSQVLQLQGRARTKDRGQSGKECRERNEHRKREL
jgi:hypothetical protein